MEPTLNIRLLGDFSLIYDDEQVTSLNSLRLQSFYYAAALEERLRGGQDRVQAGGAGEALLEEWAETALESGSGGISPCS